jgi:hypothetical protein
MKTKEIVDLGHPRFVLTVTPDRIKIKLKSGASNEDIDRVIKFFNWVSEQPMMADTVCSFRGRTNFPPTDIPLMIQMVNGSNTIKKTFYESDMK